MGKAIKASRVGDAYARLKEEIRTNRMPPGFQLPEPELALRFGMSRTPIREALIRLEAEGLVELIPRRGVRVLPIQPQDMAEIYEILTSVEPDAAAALAARNLSDEELAPLVRATATMEAALEQGDREKWAEAGELFHMLLLELHGNKRLSIMVGKLFDQAHRARMITLRLRPLPVQSTQEHSEILTNLRRGDPDAVRAVFRRHRTRAAEELLDILEQFYQPTSS
jgi:DNA-binding GntR family transcriptional regulator